MKFLRHLIPFAAVAAVLAFAIPMPASAAASYSFHVHGYVGEAYFGTWTAPSVYTEVYVSTGQAIGGNATSYTVVEADQVDFSTNPNGDLTALYFGQVPSSALNMSSKLTSASLAGAIPVTDINGNPATLSLNLAWTATGPAFKQTSNSHISGQGFKVTDHFNGTSVPAVATGSISDGTINFTGGTSSQFADLNKLTEGETDITG